MRKIKNLNEMKKLLLLAKVLTYLLILSIIACSPNTKKVTIDDANGELTETRAPVSLGVKLNNTLLSAGEEGRLGLSEKGKSSLIPAQLVNYSKSKDSSKLVILMSGEASGLHEFEVEQRDKSFGNIMKVYRDPNSGQLIIEEEGKKVLQYNYKTVYRKNVIHLSDAEKEEHEHTGVDTFVTTSRYAKPRSDYIHPLYGLNGEMLTNDWPEGGHPHHRGIFWAWPEVEYGSERGDIFALQKIFARPTGDIELESGPVFAQIEAENIWIWEANEPTIPIVREQALIRVYRATSKTRVIDLAIKLRALKDSITIATRGTDSYGGLNIRMQIPPDSQDISYFTSSPGSKPVRAWSDFSGIFEGSDSPTGLMVLQHQKNPEYPGEWVDYPELAWVQPTFPTPNTRYPLSQEEPLILRYRIIVHKGDKPGKSISKQRWDAYHHKVAPDYSFIKE